MQVESDEPTVEVPSNEQSGKRQEEKAPDDDEFLEYSFHGMRLITPDRRVGVLMMKEKVMGVEAEFFARPGGGLRMDFEAVAFLILVLTPVLNLLREEEE